jgi:hypothetical protein
MYVGEKRRGEVFTGFLWGSLMDREHLDDLGIDGRIILKWIFKKRDRGMSWIDLAQNRNRWAGSCEGGNELLNSISYVKFLTS